MVSAIDYFRYLRKDGNNFLFGSVPQWSKQKRVWEVTSPLANEEILLSDSTKVYVKEIFKLSDVWRLVLSAWYPIARS